MSVTHNNGRHPFTGCGTALVTPFNADGSLDETAFRTLGRRQIDAGVHFLVPLGTTGENPTLTRVERLRLVEGLAHEANGRVPILAGAGGYNTNEVIETVHDLQAAGADGFLSVTPYYNKPTQEGLFEHFRAIAESTTPANCSLQRTAPNCVQSGGRHGRPSRIDTQYRRRQGGVREHVADLRSLRRGPKRLHRLVW